MSEPSQLRSSAFSPVRWFAGGEPWVWLNASAVAVAVALILGMLGLIAFYGLSHFWPAKLVELTVESPDGSRSQLIGEVVSTESISRQQFIEATGLARSLPEPVLQVQRFLLRTGNRRVAPPDFRIVYQHQVAAQSTPADLFAIERREWGPAFGRVIGLLEASQPVVVDGSIVAELNARLARVRLLREQLAPDTGSEQADRFDELLAELARDELSLLMADGRTLRIPLSDVLRAWQPNSQSLLERVAHFTVGVGRFVSEPPREANTEGGVFPAIFGTVLMVLLMSVLVTPVGVLAALYLHEYARPGVFVRVVRIAVNNLAGVPSIVYGVFGLGFFVYVVGGSIDGLFFSDALPTPTFGTPGLLWASLTLALLTLPVVVVSTEEGLARIPADVREGALALGATRAEVLWRIVVPMASPSILTGVILAVARAAGEVAPLMLVGVVKLAPSLAIDGEFPFLHLERKFMHLGYHIYDLGFASPNIEAATPLVFATALLLVAVVVLLNLAAIMLRSRLEARYRGALQ